MTIFQFYEIYFVTIMNLIVIMYYTNTMKENSYIAIYIMLHVLQYGPPLHPVSNLLADYPIK